MSCSERIVSFSQLVKLVNENINVRIMVKFFMILSFFIVATLFGIFASSFLNKITLFILFGGNERLSNNLIFNENCNYKLLIFGIIQNINQRKIGLSDSLTGWYKCVSVTRRSIGAPASRRTDIPLQAGNNLPILSVLVNGLV